MRHLVVVVPGIGGSVLERPLSKGEPKRVWDVGVGGIAGLLADPGRLSLDEAERLRPVGLISSKRLLPGWTVVHGYDGIVAGIKAALPGAQIDHGHPDQRDLNADVVLFPYDFRRSIAEAAELLAAEVHDRIADLSEVERVGRVVVVAHSMGGLVARYWLGVLGGWRVCRALVTLGTPHRGAPKALGWLVNGVRVGGVPVPGMTSLIRGWPSVAELLPRYPMVRDDSASSAAGQQILYPHDLPIDWLRSRAEDAMRLHREIESEWGEIPRSGPEMVPRFGWAHRTFSAGYWDGNRLRMTKEQPEWLAQDGWEQDYGDGTVPAISALPIEDSGRDTTWMRVQERHGPLAAAGWVAEMVAAYQQRASIKWVHGEERPAAIGLDIEEMQEAGSPVPLRARFLGLDDEDAGRALDTPVWASITSDEGGPAESRRLTWDAATACFTGELPGRDPGLHTVRVSARDVPGGGDLSAIETLAVIGS